VPSPNPTAIASEVDAGLVARAILEHAGASGTEEDFKIRVEATLRPILDKWGISWPSYERRLEFTGREDALYGHVILEYKTPKTLSSPSEFKKARQQVRDYIESEAKERRNFSKYFGVVLDGFQISFVRFRNNKWEEQNKPFEVNGQTILTLLTALRGLRRRPLDSYWLLLDFGPRSEISKETIRTLYNSLSDHPTERTLMLFNDWKRVFSQVCSYSIDKLEGLLPYYRLNASVNVEKLLFAVHTYYTILMKLMTSEIVTLFADSLLGSYLQKVESAYYSSPVDMRRELAELEEGGIFAMVGIKNFLEADYFAWYLDEWDEQVAERIHDISIALLNYEPATVELKPERVKDLFKQIYQNLVPGKAAGEKADVRGKLGEFYTPDWLAELLLNEVGYDGNPNLRVLDPACGSGTFLVLAIKRIRQYAEDNFLDQRELISKIIQNVQGIDLNPLAVLAAKANYLIALSDLLRYRPKEGIDIPIYLADSISVVRIPSQSKQAPDELELQTNEGRFWITDEVIQKKLLYPMLSSLSDSVKLGLSRNEFQSLLKKRFPLTNSTISSFERLYKKIVDLEKVQKNKIWASLLKNSFSPLLIGKFDLVIGNPPWINWESLPGRYRDTTRYLWENYGLMETSQGAIKQDISMLFLLRCLDLYVNDKGRLGFLMPFTIFKTKSGAGFRNGLAQKYHVTKADDLVELYPFEGAVNRTSAIVVYNGETKFPIPCTMWMNPDHNTIGQEMELSQVMSLSRQYESILTPIDPKSYGSAWMETSESVYSALEKVTRASSYRAYAGTYTGADGIYLVRPIKRQEDTTMVENLALTAKKEQRKVTAVLENQLLYPVLRGRDVGKWHSKTELDLLVPHDPEGARVFAETKMRVDFPKAYGYLLSFKSPLVRRTIKPFLGDKKRTLPFYTLDNMGERTFAKHKVVWKHISGKVSGKAVLECAVVSRVGDRPILTTHGLMFIPLQDEDEAHFVCAVLNSSVAHLIVMSYGLEVHLTTDVLKYVFVPDFDKKNRIHMELSRLSREAHHAASASRIDEKKLTQIEHDIDKATAEIYGLTGDDQAQIIQSLKILEGIDKTQKTLV
jgi:SAM-dependent methyltransferase